MSILDKFLNSIRLNDDFDDDDEFFDEEEAEEEEEKPKRRFFKSLDDDDDDEEEQDEEVVRPAKKVKESSKAATSSKTEKQPQQTQTTTAASSKITPMRNKKPNSTSNMEVRVIRPSSMDETREIADILLNRCTVVLNLEGIDVEVAQRIIDFSSGACYSLDGKLQKISSYIFILTPATVEISGDFQEILSGSFDVPSARKSF